MSLIPQVTGAVLNSLWQAAVLTLLVWLGIKLLRPRLNAATRYLIWWMVLAAIVVLPGIPRHVTPSQPGARSLAQRTATTLPIRVTAPLAPPADSVPFTVARRRGAVWPWLVLGVWAAFLALRVTKMLRSYFHLRHVKQQSTPWPRSLPGLRRRARLLVSSAVSSPVAVGFLSPAVILPEILREQLTPTEVNYVLLHESAHLARYDDWVNLLARALGAVLALHPVARWILLQIEQEREIACDDWVVARTGMARSYAASLVRIIELRIRPVESVLASGVFTRRSRVLERIEMVLRQGRQFSAVAAPKAAIAAAIALTGLALAGALVPQWIAFAQRLEFEVSSVKAHADVNGPFEFGPKRSGDRVSVHNIHIFSVITYAYHVSGYQLIGYPTSDYTWYDIDAKIGRDATEDEVRLMFQSLLEDRFKFKVHRERRELPEYELIIARGKAKMTPASNDASMKLEIEGRQVSWPKGGCGNTLWVEGAHLICHDAPMEKIGAAIGGEMRAPVADRTGLTGTYDLNLLFTSENRQPRPDDTPAPSLSDALQTDLGLKLQKGKGPVDVLVIDHMEKPSGN